MKKDLDENKLLLQVYFFVETFLWTLLLVNLRCQPNHISVGSKFKIDIINRSTFLQRRCWLNRQDVNLHNYAKFKVNLITGCGVTFKLQGLITQKQTSLGTSF